MKKIKNKAFYFNLIPFVLFICIDGFVNVSFTWILIEKYNSILSLGICLSISSLLCYFIQTKSSLMKSFLLKRTNLFFFLKTFILTLFSLGIFYLNTNDLFQKYWIMGAMIFYNSFIFMNYNLIDGFIAKNILRQKISSSHGSLISQVSTQIGTLLGYTIGGRVFSIYGMTGTIKLILFFLGFILMASFLTLFKKEQDVNKDSTKQNQNNSTLIANKVISLELWFAAICLLMLSIQIASFNLLIPDILINSKGWTAEIFGYLSGMASVGAFIASFIIYKGRYYFAIIISVASLIPFADISLLSFNSTYLCFLIAFLLGFSLNSLRSTFRKNIFAGLETQEDISKWVSLSNLFTFMPRAIFPLIASLLIVSISADIILSVTGIIVFLMISILTYILRQKQRKNTLLNNIKVGKNTHVCNHS